MKKLFRTTVEIPLDDYINLVLLVAEGYVPNVKTAIQQAISAYIRDFEFVDFRKLRRKYKDIIKGIENSKSVVVRGSVRRWIPDEEKYKKR